MKTFTRPALFVILALITVSCLSTRLTKKGSKMEEAGMYADAAELYYQAVVAKPTNVDAKMGMKRTGQRVLEKKLSAFNKAYNEGNNKEAVYNFKDADDYYNKITGIGVELNFPGFYREYYDEVKDIYLADKYVEANKYLDAANFTDAERLFREIVSLQPNYKDAKEKLNISVYEPVYREAQIKMDNKLYRTAYYHYDRIIKEYGNYKDSYDLRAECLKKATLTLAIYPVENKSSTSGINATLEAGILKAIQEKQNPFLTLIEASSQTGQGNMARPVADISLYTSVTAFTYEKGTLNKTEKRGYLKKTRQVKDEEGNTKTVTEYDKVVYNEFNMGRSVKISFTYRLIRNKTGEIIGTNSHSFVSEDRIAYAEYSGNSKNLVPGYWKSASSSSQEDVIHDNQKDVKALQELLNGRKVIKDYNTLTGEIIEVSSSRIADAVNNYDPER
ncbi:MAG TPA: hypothetical protein PLM49_00645 [Bacteroidales bacterium]|nr:hypothetical protein [Bacteroidales bacterium]